MGKRHLTPAEINEQCKRIARESRMADRSPWTAMGIICGYVLMKSEGFKAGRIVKICQKIDEYENLYHGGELKVDDVSKRLYEKAEWTIECKDYTEADIIARKGSYQYWLDQKQLDPQNRINRQATRYMIFMFSALMDEYGYGKARLTRVQEEINTLLLAYQQNKTTVNEWKKALYEETGIVFENPIDPLTQEVGSFMTGGL